MLLRTVNWLIFGFAKVGIYLFLCVEISSKDSLQGTQIAYHIMNYPSGLLSSELVSKESTEPCGNGVAQRSGKSPSEQSKILSMQRDLFLNGNVKTFIYSDKVPYK